MSRLNRSGERYRKYLPSTVIKNGRYWKNILLHLFCGLLFCSTFSAQSAESLPYPVLDSGVLAPRTGGSVHWLDNQRVVFVGYRETFEIEDKVLRKDSHAKGSWLGIWDVRSGEAKVYKRSVGAINCFNSIDQSIIYASWNDKAHAAEWFLGRFMEEKSFGVQNISQDMDFFDCTYPRQRDYPGELRGEKDVTKLLKGQGYLWRDDRTQENIPAGLYDTQGKRVVNLPLPPMLKMGDELPYYSFKGAYFLPKGYSYKEGKRTVLLTSDPHVGWWVYPNGKVEEVRIPSRTQVGMSGRCSQGCEISMYFFPTKMGVLFSLNTLDEKGGVYLARGEKLVRVIGGAVYEKAAVSPDGCKVAFLHRPSPTKQLREWIKAIDLCKSPQGDRLFTPDAAYKGVMSFKYQVSDAIGNVSTAINSATGLEEQMKGTVYLQTPDLPSDPLALEQWYLSETNVIPVWQDYTGKGIRIGQFEPGGAFAVGLDVLDYTHPDLQGSVDAAWLNDPANPVSQTFSNHATMVAGVMVAGRNGLGGIGVAYDAKVSGNPLPVDLSEYYLPQPGQQIDLGGKLDILYNMKNYDVVNASWNTTGTLAWTVLTGSPDPHEQAYSEAANDDVFAEKAWMRGVA